MTCCGCFWCLTVFCKSHLTIARSKQPLLYRLCVHTSFFGLKSQVSGTWSHRDVVWNTRLWLDWQRVRPSGSFSRGLQFTVWPPGDTSAHYAAFRPKRRRKPGEPVSSEPALVQFGVQGLWHNIAAIYTHDVTRNASLWFFWWWKFSLFSVWSRQVTRYIIQTESLKFESLSAPTVKPYVL